MSLQKEDIQNRIQKLSSKELEVVLMIVCGRAELRSIKCLARWLSYSDIDPYVYSKLNRNLINTKGHWTFHYGLWRNVNTYAALKETKN